MTSVSLVESSPQGGNPIDLVEEIVIANDWNHDRAHLWRLSLAAAGMGRTPTCGDHGGSRACITQGRPPDLDGSEQ